MLVIIAQTPFSAFRENITLITGIILSVIHSTYIIFKNSLGMPETSLSGRSTRIALKVRRFTLDPSVGNIAINLS